MKYLCYILCHHCLSLCQVSVLALMPLVCPGWLLCCLLSSAALLGRHLHLSTSCCTAASCRAPILLWCGCLLSSPAVCCVTSCHTAASRPPAPLPSFATTLFIAPLSRQLSGWLLHCLSSQRRLLFTGASNSRHATASCCTSLVPCVHSG
jgi:hypothetical protein